MRQFVKFVAEFVSREDGPTAVEYAVMLALIVTVCVSSITTLGSNTNKALSKAGNAFVSAS